MPNGGLYAIEQVGPNLFVACALHSWVSEDWCRDAELGKVAEVKVEDLLKNEDGPFRGHERTASESSSTALPTLKSPRRPTNRRGALARMSILNAKEPPGQSLIERSRSPSVALQPVVAPCPVTEPLPITIASPQTETQNPPEINTPTDREVFEPETIPDASTVANENPIESTRLRMQYFEHLYTSKTSLAFYVKGPLSRARAHVRSAECPSRSITELSEFYDGTILPTKKMDLKYKESLSKVIKELPLEQAGQDAAKKKSRKRKSKLGKDCLWPDEEEFVGKWWRGRDLKPTIPSLAQVEEVRKELGELRMRETKMQLLLILEVMLLEIAASRLSERPSSTNDPDIKVESVEEEAAVVLATTPQKPSKKKRDLSREIDTIIDRLCIWHTVSMDELTATEKAKNSSQSKSNDSLRDFCKDVLLPFYSAKLPDQIKAISRKLGGPEISPKRPSQSRPPMTSKSSSSSSIAKSKPGQPLTKRTLERVLSEDHFHRHVSPPTLTRSSTAPMPPIVPTLKREPSERPMSRGGMLSKSVSFSNREIDLVADSKAHEAKRRKLDRLSQQKRELEAAIDALKRPNRTTLAGAFMDEVEKRKEKTVQISATPRARRVKEQTEPELPPMPRSVFQEHDTAIIPSSTMKPRSRPDLPGSANIPRSSATKRAVLAGIHETPSRGIGQKTSNPLDLPATGPSPVTDPNTVVATPAPKRTPPDLDLFSSELHISSSQLRGQGSGSAQRLCMTRSRRPVLFTPVKRSDVRLDDAFRDAPEIPEQAGRMMDRAMGGKGRGLDVGFEDPDEDVRTHSAGTAGVAAAAQRKKIQLDDVDDGVDIYDRLGWNDDFDL